MKAKFKEINDMIKETLKLYVMPELSGGQLEVVTDTRMTPAGLRILAYIRETKYNKSLEAPDGDHNRPCKGQAILEGMEPEKDGPDGLQASQKNSL